MRRSEKKKKHAQLIFGLFVVALMVFSAFGFVMSYSSGSGSTYKYGDYTFRSTEQGLKAKIGGKTSYFTSFPGDLEDIELPASVAASLSNTKMVYLTSDPDSRFFRDIGLVEYYFQDELNDLFGIYGVISITKNSTYQLPVISCSDATASVPVLYLMQSNETKISFEDNCIMVEAPSQSVFVRLKDRIIFSLLGVMK